MIYNGRSYASIVTWSSKRWVMQNKCTNYIRASRQIIHITVKIIFIKKIIYISQFLDENLKKLKKIKKKSNQLTISSQCNTYTFPRLRLFPLKNKHTIELSGDRNDSRFFGNFLWKFPKNKQIWDSVNLLLPSKVTVKQQIK